MLMISCDLEMTSFTRDETTAIRSVTFTACCLSIIGCLFVMFSYVRFPALRSFALKLVFIQSITDLFGSFSTLMSVFAAGSSFDTTNAGEHFACVLQGAGIQFFYLSAFIWTLFIALTAYFMITRPFVHLEDYEKYFHMIAWGIPGLFLVILLSLNSFGEAGVWCWIEDPESPFRFAFFYGPMIAILFINLAIYAVCHRELNKLQTNDGDEYAPKSANMDRFRDEISRRLLSVVISWVFCWMWAVINRIQNIIDPEHPQKQVMNETCLCGMCLRETGRSQTRKRLSCGHVCCASCLAPERVNFVSSTAALFCSVCRKIVTGVESEQKAAYLPLCEGQSTTDEDLSEVTESNTESGSGGESRAKYMRVEGRRVASSENAGSSGSQRADNGTDLVIGNECQRSSPENTNGLVERALRLKRDIVAVDDRAQLALEQDTSRITNAKEAVTEKLNTIRDLLSRVEMTVMQQVDDEYNKHLKAVNTEKESAQMAIGQIDFIINEKSKSQAHQNTDPLSTSQTIEYDILDSIARNHLSQPTKIFQTPPCINDAHKTMDFILYYIKIFLNNHTDSHTQPNSPKVSQSPRAASEVFARPQAQSPLPSQSPARLMSQPPSPTPLRIMPSLQPPVPLSPSSEIVTSLPLQEPSRSRDQHHVIRTIGKLGRAPQQFVCPFGLARHPGTGAIFVADGMNFRIQQLSAQLDFTKIFGEKGISNMQFNYPIGIAISPQGMVAVSEGANHRIQLMTDEFVHVKTIGQKGSNPGEFHKPHHLAFDAEGNLFVSDSGNNRIQMFDSRGAFVRFVVNSGSVPDLTQCDGLMVTSDNTIGVIGFGGSKVHFLTPQGNYIRCVHVAPVRDYASLCGAPGGGFFVASYNDNRIHMYSADGKVIRNIVCNHPWGIALQPGGRLYVSSRDAHTITMYALGYLS